MSHYLDARVQVSVPATSANLGPGFDTLGLALDHRDTVTAEVRPGGGVEIVVCGEGSDQVPRDSGHLVYQAMCHTFEAMALPVPPGVRLHCTNAIPHSRGLGSSSAAIVAGISLARSLVAEGTELIDGAAALDLAATLEGHPDNVTPALLGGFTIAITEEGRCSAVRLRVNPAVRVVVFVPPETVATAVARDLLPEWVRHTTAAANAGRAAMMVAALTERPELLLLATRDWLHQSHREPVMPESLALVGALRDHGVAAVVSGAGPSVLAFVESEAGSAATAARAPDRWRALPLRVDEEGARVRILGADEDPR